MRLPGFVSPIFGKAFARAWVRSAEIGFGTAWVRALKFWGVGFVRQKLICTVRRGMPVFRTQVAAGIADTGRRDAGVGGWATGGAGWGVAQHGVPFSRTRMPQVH